LVDVQGETIMKQWQRLFFYLVLNVLVSACTTLGVLFIWDQVYGPLPRGLLPGAFENRAQSTPTAQNTPATLAIAQVTPTEAFIVHQVQENETFESIAEKYSVSVDELIAVNGFPQVQLLGPGEILRIPVNPQGSVEIDRVVAAGDLENERVILKHRGVGELSLVGWRLQDEQGNEFIFPEFPQLTLYDAGVVNVYTKPGVNTVVDLFWGMNQAIWRSGATVSLSDPSGVVRDTYKIP
jgi:LysM repeat protein